MINIKTGILWILGGGCMITGGTITFNTYDYVDGSLIIDFSLY